MRVVAEVMADMKVEVCWKYDPVRSRTREAERVSSQRWTEPQLLLCTADEPR